MKWLYFLIMILILSGSASAGLFTEIYYTAEHVSDNQWLCNYTVSNVGLTEGIEEFTIWFDHDNYSSIQKASDAALDTSWDQIVWQPNASLMNNGGFDALALTDPINIGESVSGYAVSFQWHGEGEPGRQFYEIVNPDNQDEVLDSGFTVPEPTSVVLLGLSSIYVIFRRNNRVSGRSG